MKVEQFSRKRYKGRQDLSGVQIGYGYGWYTQTDPETGNTVFDDEYCYQTAMSGFRNDAAKLNDGEYFRREIFGQWHIAYKKDGEIYYK